MVCSLVGDRGYIFQEMLDYMVRGKCFCSSVVPSNLVMWFITQHATSGVLEKLNEHILQAVCIIKLLMIISLILLEKLAAFSKQNKRPHS